MLGHQKSLPAQYTLTQTANSSVGVQAFSVCLKLPLVLLLNALAN
jgi:hypothetical protein